MIVIRGGTVLTHLYGGEIILWTLPNVDLVPFQWR